MNQFDIDEISKAINKLFDEKRDTEQFLRLIAPEYMGVYVVDRTTDHFRDILGPDYFRKIVNEKDGHFSEALKIYMNQYVAEADQSIIAYMLDYDSIYEVLLSGRDVNLSYRKKDNANVALKIRRYSQKKEEENLSLWVFTNEEINNQKKEAERQQQLSDAYAVLKKSNDELKLALDKAELENEIIAAIGKSYYYISRIDLEEDYYEVVSGFEKFPDNVKLKGNFSKNVYQNCKTIVDEKYVDDLVAFLDISTLADRLQSEESVFMEYRMQNGDWRRVRLIVKKRNEQGRVTHVLCAVRNISADKKRELELQFKAQEARRETKEKTRFLSNMSHDIRTPMNGIVGLIDMAERYPDDMEMQAQCRIKIKELSGHLVSLVNDILDINKLQSDDLVIENTTFDIAEMLRTLNEASQLDAAKKDIEYVVNWEESKLNHRYIVGSPVYTARILSIFADNAIKFSHAGSRIVVSCTEKYADDENVVYSFFCRDHGIGMSKEFAEHAFDMFSQENETSRINYEGSGLGLAIAKQLADRLHGKIRLETEKGVGTTTILEMPFKIGNADDIPVAYTLENVSLQGLRVLIAEDNELNMEIARFILEDQGLITECASNGAECVQMFEASEPGYYDVILMDIMMPELNGLDATRKIRALPRKDAERIPIIAMSANALADDIIKSRLAGMNEHLTKPLDAKKIMEAIRKNIHNDMHQSL